MEAAAMSMPEAPEMLGTGPGWAALFWEAFIRSKNAMLLLDDQRRHVAVNGAYLALSGFRPSDIVGRPVYEHVAGGPLVTEREWRAILQREHFTGTADLVCSNGHRVTVD